MHSDLDWTRQLIRWIRAACVMEATAPKPGNVHPGAAFEDVTYEDFVRSAEIVAPVLARAGELGVGWVMLEAVRATQAAIGRNTNLGIVRPLLAPLAAVPREPLPAEGDSDRVPRGLCSRSTTPATATRRFASRQAWRTGHGRGMRTSRGKPAVEPRGSDAAGRQAGPGGRLNMPTDSAVWSKRECLATGGLLRSRRLEDGRSSDCIWN